MVGRTRTTVVLVLGVLMLAGAGLGGYLLFQAEREDDDAPPAAEPVLVWTGYRVLPQGLEITGTRSACQEIAAVEVAEKRKRVEITLEVSGDAADCAGSDVPLRRKVRLEAPLRDRAVYDGGCLATSDDPETCLRSEGAGA